MSNLEPTDLTFSPLAKNVWEVFYEQISLGSVKQGERGWSICHHTKNGDFAYFIHGFVDRDYATSALFHVAQREGLVKINVEDPPEILGI